MTLSEEEKEQICRLVCAEMEQAGEGGFAATVFFGDISIFNNRIGRPVGLRNRANIGQLVRAAGFTRKELEEFRGSLTPEMTKRIENAKRAWHAKMKEVWGAHLKQIDAEMVTRAQG